MYNKNKLIINKITKHNKNSEIQELERNLLNFAVGMTNSPVPEFQQAREEPDPSDLKIRVSSKHSSRRVCN